MALVNIEKENIFNKRSTWVLLYYNF